MQPSKRIFSFLKDSIFEEIGLLASQPGIKNLGSGYTEWDTPQFLKDFLYQSTVEHENQYGRSGGQPLLVKAISKEYSGRLQREIDPLREVVVCNGATGALTNACCAFLNEGDEVVTFEPGFESYFVQPMMFGGILRTFALTEPRGDSDKWTINFEEFEKLFNEKTRFLILNTPQNPTGKVFDEDEIKKFVDIAHKWPRLIVIMEEIYEHMCYDSHKHLRIATYPGMWERVISIYTASKAFSCAGWRIGWAISSCTLVGPLTAAQNWLNLNVSRPSQMAVAKSLEYVTNTPYVDGKLFYNWIEESMQRKKDLLVKALKNSFLKIKIYEPEGGFFVLVDITEMIPLIPRKYFYKTENTEKFVENSPMNQDKRIPDYSPDYAFVRWLATEYKVISIPCFPFYDQSNATNVGEYKGSHLVRFALCKNDETIIAAAEALARK